MQKSDFKIINICNDFKIRRRKHLNKILSGSSYYIFIFLVFDTHN